METILNLAAYAFLLVAVILSTISLWKGSSKLEKTSFWLLGGAFISLTAALIIRGVTLGRVPFATLYEFTFLFVWGILLLYLFVRARIQSGMFTTLIGVLAFILISYGGTMSAEAKPLMPALQSHWLQIHVATAIIGYGAFGLSFCFGIMYLIKEKSKNKDGQGLLPPLTKIDNLVHLSVVVGFPFLSLVLITGAVWAEEVWGTWWSWDPKETWALITWLVYAAYLHARKTYGWKGRRAAIMAIAGFLVVLFTLFGVSFLMPGYHSYT